jgi:hypothetical protein
MLRLKVTSLILTFITCNDGGDEAGVIFGLFLKLRTEGNAVFLLVIVQQPGHKFCRNAPDVMLVTEFADMFHTTI